MAYLPFAGAGGGAAGVPVHVQHVQAQAQTQVQLVLQEALPQHYLASSSSHPLMQPQQQPPHQQYVYLHPASAAGPGALVYAAPPVPPRPLHYPAPPVPSGQAPVQTLAPPHTSSSRVQSRWRTKLCSFHLDSDGAHCPHGAACQFAHGPEQLRVPGLPGRPSVPAPREVVEAVRSALKSQQRKAAGAAALAEVGVGVGPTAGRPLPTVGTSALPPLGFALPPGYYSAAPYGGGQVAAAEGGGFWPPPLPSSLATPPPSLLPASLGSIDDKEETSPAASLGPAGLAPTATLGAGTAVASVASYASLGSAGGSLSLPSATRHPSLSSVALAAPAVAAPAAVLLPPPLRGGALADAPATDYSQSLFSIAPLPLVISTAPAEEDSGRGF